MKYKFKSLLLLAIGFIIAAVYTSCSDDDKEVSGRRVRYVRITDPTSSDSLVVQGLQNNMVAIVGDKLGGAQQVWFNDRRAALNPSLVSDHTIITTIPGEIPKNITNKLAIVFGKGDTLFYDFAIKISKPDVVSMKCEYVKDGSTATIYGRYFYAPLTVVFTGGLEGKIDFISDDSMQVVVPTGAQAGPITVSSPFGTSKSGFWFRDSRNIFISSDPYTGWWNAKYVVNSPGAGDPEAINGNYIRVKEAIGGWAWIEVAGGPADAMGEISKNIPDAAILTPENYNFKFEVNTLKPYSNNVIKFNIGLKEANNNEYRWLPPYDTQGQWETVVIPFETIVKSYNTKLVVSPNGYWTRLLFHGPGDLNADIAFDNFRLVPKK